MKGKIEKERLGEYSARPTPFSFSKNYYNKNTKISNNYQEYTSDVTEKKITCFSPTYIKGNYFYLYINFLWIFFITFFLEIPFICSSRINFPSIFFAS